MPGCTYRVTNRAVRVLLGWTVLVAVVWSLPLAAQLAGGNPVEAIKARDAAVRSILESTSSDEDLSDATRERLKDIINDVMDFHELSHRALGKYWDERTEEEKTAFVDVFQQLIRNSSVKKLTIYRADSIEYHEPRMRGERATVQTIAHKDRKTVEIVYQMHSVGNQWKAYDMVVDGSSTARTYRDSFYREIAKSSYEVMFDKLVKKLADET